MRALHISDLHIKLSKGLIEQRQVFETLYQHCRELKPDLIINTGDTFHNKLNLSTAAVDQGVDLLRSLVEFAPVYNLLGNHDFIINSKHKPDAMSPIVKAIDNPNLKVFKNSTTFDVENFRFYVLSLFDPENWSKFAPNDSSKINVALFHGSVKGCSTDIGYEFDHGDIDLSVLKQYDYALLGDIHKPQALDPDGRIRYAGSLCQNNFGEDNDKGFLLWDIESKDKFECKHIHIPNPRPYVTLQLDKNGHFEPFFEKIPEGSRIRLVSNSKLSHLQIKFATELAKQKWKPETVVYFNKNLFESSNSSISGSHNEFVTIGNLRDLKTQETLIRNCLKDYNLSEKALNDVLLLNEKYTKLALAGEDTFAFNGHWKIKSLEWGNLLNYGPKNIINFEKLRGQIVGIFGKNYSGKSASVSALLYTLFNTTDRNERKNVNIINQNQVKGWGQGLLQIGEDKYSVYRESEKYEKKLHGQVSIEAKTKVEFHCPTNEFNEQNLNGDSRNDTDNQIRSYIGTVEDFFMTSMMTQHNSLALIDEGATKKKEVLARFLDLEIFEKKFKLAKERQSDLRAFLKRFDGNDFDGKLKEKRKLLATHTEDIKVTQENVSKAKKALDGLKTEIFKLEADIKDFKNSNGKFLETEARLKASKRELDRASVSSKSLVKSLATIEQKLKAIEDYEAKYNDLLNSRGEIEELNEEFIVRETVKTVLEETFGVEIASPVLNALIENLQKLSDGLSYEEIRGKISSYDKLKSEQQALLSEKDKLVSQQTSNDALVEKTKNDIAQDEQTLSEYKDAEAQIESFEEAHRQKLAEQKTKEKILSQQETKVLDLTKAIGSLEQEIKQTETQRDEFVSMNEEFSSYELFLSCMHPGGIPFQIIKKAVPAINNIISDILASIVDFEIFFDDDASGKHLDVFIKHPQYDPRPLSMGSGSEKMIGSLAVRLALIRLSNIPISNVLILDEPATALDAEHMEGFISMLSMLKEHFETVILISHEEVLKDAVDNVIAISKNEDGSACIDLP